MMPENTTENKARFYGLYLGAELGNRKIFTDPQKLTISNFATVVRFSSTPLVLTPLSHITDEDARRLTIIMGDYDDYFRLDNWSGYAVMNGGGEEVQVYDDGEIQANTSSSSRFLLAFDFLRSSGYALPWMGLSVEDQIKYGWIKLRKNENS